MTAGVTCADHPDRRALGYCGRCGKALCTACLVRLSTGNYCERCADEAGGPVHPARGAPHGGRRGPKISWWGVALAVLLGLMVLRLLLR